MPEPGEEAGSGSGWNAWLELTRPFTLLPPLLGMGSGAATAWGAAARRGGHALSAQAGIVPLQTGIVYMVLGGLLAVLLNAASNALNQVCDLKNDRVNKPDRPIPSGRLSSGAALRACAVLAALALSAAWFIAPGGSRACFVIGCLAALGTWAYSSPPLRLRRFAWPALITVALVRGCLLKVAGWSTLAPVWNDPEPWAIGAVFALFLLGATVSKDFSDIPGDRAAGCRTLPAALGPLRAARRIAPFFVAPWLLLPIGTFIPRGGSGGTALLSGNQPLLCALGGALALYGVLVVRSLLRDPDALATTENHPAWRQMYVMMMAAQVGLAAAYLI